MKKAIDLIEKLDVSSKLKFGIMCNPDLTFPQQQVNSIMGLLNIKGIDCSLFILDARVTDSSQLNFIQRLKYLKLKSFFSDKTHHLSSVGTQTLIDGCKKVFIFETPLQVRPQRYARTQHGKVA